MFPHLPARLLACLALLPAFPAPCAAPSADPPGHFRYHLLNPVPAADMREMSTDRPDTTESPYTVDAGHFQLEMSFFDYSRDANGPARFEAWSFGQVNFKAGLTTATDLQIVFNTWSRERTTDAGVVTRLSGFSDVMLRLKTNIWGNDEGRTALALMPYVKIPTGVEVSNGEWEGGLIIPFGLSLTDRIALGLMSEVDVVSNGAGSHIVEWLHSATVGVALTERLGVYFEAVGIAGTASDFQAIFNSGLTCSLTDNLVLDAGVRIGLNRTAPDFGVFTGLSARF